LKPFLLSHIKAPLREEKREAADCLNQIYQKESEIDPKSRQNQGDLSILDGNQATSNRLIAPVSVKPSRALAQHPSKS
jgi:hypothetical protein